MQDKINIVFAANDDYACHMSATMASVLKNANKNDSFKFYILNNDFTDITKQKIEKLKKIKDFEIEYLDIDLNDFKDCPTIKHLTIQTYFRIIMPTIIKEKKVLYLDSDIIVRKSLKELFEIDINDYVAAAVEDLFLGKNGINQFYLENLNIHNYFNAGVMLWNLDKARELNIQNKCFEFIKKYPEKLLCADQDAINSVCEKHVKYIDNRFNFLHTGYHPNIMEKLYKEKKNEIVIIHFVSDLKPWCFDKEWTFVQEYYRYQFMTPFRFDFSSLFKKKKNWSYYKKCIKRIYMYFIKQEIFF